MNSNNYFKFPLLMALLAGSAACGFMGTEVGNGFKDKREGQDTGRSTENPTPASDFDKDSKSEGKKKSESFSQEDQSQSNAEGEDISPTVDTVIASPNTGKSVASVITDVFLSTCGSVFSLPLVHPVKLALVEAAAETVAVSADFVAPNWSLVVDGQTVADIAEQKSTTLAYDVVVSAREGIRGSPSYNCGSVAVSADVILPNHTEPVDRFQVSMTTPVTSYQVTWYLAPGPSPQNLATLLRYEIRMLGVDGALVLAAPME